MSAQTGVARAKLAANTYFGGHAIHAPHTSCATGFVYSEDSVLPSRRDCPRILGRTRSVGDAPQAVIGGRLERNIIADLKLVSRSGMYVMGH
jgi:hypothetical protein